MNKLSVLLGFLLLLSMCSARETGRTQVKEQIILGAERLDEYLPALADQRVGLVVNQTSTIGAVHLVDTLLALGVDIVKVMAPEHGFRGDHADGATIENAVDEKTGIPVVSIYGRTKRPTPDMMADLDVVIFDIQDVGVRFYTFISTMHYVMEACAENGKKCIVLDRPNPNGFYVDGPVLKEENSSFIGMHPIPIVHGLTVGELALMINGQQWLEVNGSKGHSCELQIVPCLNYTHQSLYQLPIAPSPNLPNMNSVYLYPFLGLFEGTNVSVGRGTDSPFQQIGRPGFKGPHFFTPHSIPGVSDHPKHQDELCGGMRITEVTDSTFFENPSIRLHYLLLFHETNSPSADGDFFRNYIHKLIGYKEFAEQVRSGWTEAQIRQTWEEDLAAYRVMRKKYLLYP